MCPGCASFVRHDWAEHCGNCGASLFVDVAAGAVAQDGTQKETSAAPRNDRLNLPVLIGAGVIAVLVCAGGLGYSEFKPEKADVSLTSAAGAASETTTTVNAVQAATTTSAAAVTTTVVTTTSTTTPALTVLREAATKSGKLNTFGFDVTVSSNVYGNMLTETGYWSAASGLCSFAIKGQGIDSEMVYDTKKNDLYMKLNPAQQSEPGKTWGKISDPGSLNFNPKDATGALAIISSANSKVRDLGSADVDGVATRRYRFDVDAEALTAINDNPDAKKLLQTYGGLEIQGEVFVDKDSNIHKIVMTLDTGKSANNVGTITVTEKFTDLNKSVKVALPPASQISSQEYELHS